MNKVNHSPYRIMVCGILFLFSHTVHAASKKNPGYAAATQSSRSRTQTRQSPTTRSKTPRPRPTQISTSLPDTQTGAHQQSTFLKDQHRTSAQPDTSDNQKIDTATSTAVSAAAAAATASHHNTPSRLSPPSTPGSSSNSSPENSPTIGTRRTTQTTSAEKLAAALAQARTDRLMLTAATAQAASSSSSKIKRPGNGNAPVEKIAAQSLLSAPARAQKAAEENEKKLTAITTKSNAPEQSTRTVKILFHPNPGSGIIDTFEDVPEITETKELAEKLSRRIQQTGAAISASDFAVISVAKRDLPRFLNGQLQLHGIKLLDKTRLVDLPGGRYDQQIYVTLSSHAARQTVAKAYEAAKVPKELEATAAPCIATENSKSATRALTLLERLQALTGSATPVAQRHSVFVASSAPATHLRTSSAPAPTTVATSPASSAAANAARPVPTQISPPAALPSPRPPVNLTPTQRHFRVNELLGQITLPRNAQSADIRDAVGKAYTDTITAQFIMHPYVYDKSSREILLQTDQPIDSFAGRAANEDIFLCADEGLRKKAFQAAALARIRAEFEVHPAGTLRPKIPLKVGEQDSTHECRRFFVDETEGTVTLQPKEESAAAIKETIARICTATQKKLLLYPFLLANREMILQSPYALQSLRGRNAHEGVALLDPKLVAENAYTIKSEQEWGTESAGSSASTTDATTSSSSSSVSTSTTHVFTSSSAGSSAAAAVARYI